MEKKGRNEEKPRRPQIDLSNQQQEGGGKINMNRTVLPQERIFDKRNGGDPMKMTAEDKSKNNNGDYKKMQSRKIVEDRLSSSEEQQFKPQNKKESSKNRDL